MPVSKETGVRVHLKVWCIEVKAARGGAAANLSKVGCHTKQNGFPLFCTRSLVIGVVLAMFWRCPGGGAGCSCYSSPKRFGIR